VPEDEQFEAAWQTVQLPASGPAPDPGLHRPGLPDFLEMSERPDTRRRKAVVGAFATLGKHRIVLTATRRALTQRAAGAQLRHDQA